MNDGRLDSEGLTGAYGIPRSINTIDNSRPAPKPQKERQKGRRDSIRLLALSTPFCSMLPISLNSVLVYDGPISLAAFFRAQKIPG